MRKHYSSVLETDFKLLATLNNHNYYYLNEWDKSTIISPCLCALQSLCGLKSHARVLAYTSAGLPSGPLNPFLSCANCKQTLTQYQLPELTRYVWISSPPIQSQWSNQQTYRCLPCLPALYHRNTLTKLISQCSETNVFAQTHGAESL